MTETTRVPVVSYLSIDDGPAHLVGTRCEQCGAIELGRRSGCPSCGADSFGSVALPTRGTVESFTIVHRGAPKATGPFVSALIRLDDGTYVKANLLVPPDPAVVDLHRPVELRTFVAGTDDDGTEAIAFGFSEVPDPGSGA